MKKNRHRAQARHMPLVDGLDWTVPWAILPATLTEIASLVRSAAIPMPSAGPLAQLDDRNGAARTAGAVAVLTLRGVITPRASWLSILFGGGYGLDMFRQAFRDALADDEITAILIELDSPGGRCDLVAETAHEIYAARGQKPIVAISNTLCASAAYWIASAADEIVVTPSGYVGSIGAYITHLETSKFDEELGFTYTLISAGKHKTDGNEVEPLSDSGRDNFQEIVDDCYEHFVADVAAGRGVSTDTVIADYGQGRCLNAQRALSAGIVDRVATYDEVLAGLLGREPTGATAAMTSIDIKAALAELVAGQTAALQVHLDALAENTDGLKEFGGATTFNFSDQAQVDIDAATELSDDERAFRAALHTAR